MDKLFGKFPLKELTPEQEANAYRHICPTCNTVSLLHQIIYQYGCMKKCYICGHIVVLARRGEAVKYITGDQVYLIKLNKEGTVLHNEGTKLHPYYVSFDNNKDTDFFAEEDIEPSRIPVLRQEQIDWIIHRLHQYGSDRQPMAFGLPIYNENDMAAMREIVRLAVSPAYPALPERREQPRLFTELDKKIAEQAALFEEHLGVHPERRDSTVLPWGWRYTSDTIQRQFREYCNDLNNKN